MALGLHGCSSRLVAEQSKLAEVVTLLLVHEPALALLDGLGLALFDDVELVACVALVDYLLVVVEGLFGEAVRQLFALLLVDLAEDVDAAQEVEQLLPAVDGAVLDVVVERGAVQCPQHAVGGGPDVGLALLVLHEREFAEGLALDLRLDVHFGAVLDRLRTLQRALLHELHFIAVVVLLDDLVALAERAAAHGVDDGVVVVGVDGFEDEAFLE